MSGLERRLGLRAATIANILAMIGVGPFLTIPLLLAAMNGPQAMLGWIVGGIVVCCDGLAWAELGAAMPESGGAYHYVLEAYGPHGAGQLVSFLFLWQTMIAGPLIMASGAVGFAQYAMYLYPTMGAVTAKALALSVCLVATVLIYRRIDGAGRWGIAFGYVIAIIAVWVVADGLIYGRLSNIAIPAGAFHPSPTMWTGLGAATLYAVYDYGGYNTVCFVGGEVVRPQVTIPRAIVVAILITIVLYLGMTFTVVGVMPIQDAMHSKYVISDLMARLHGPAAASVMTVLILITTVAGVFAGMLGLSRVPYAAAVEGRFLSVFARCHAKGFPSVAVLYIGIATSLGSLLDLDALIKLCTITAIIASLAVVGGPVALRWKRPDIARPFRMWLYPLPCLLAAAGWVYVATTNGLVYIGSALGVLGIGAGAYFWRAKRIGAWPWGQQPSH